MTIMMFLGQYTVMPQDVYITVSGELLEVEEIRPDSVWMRTKEACILAYDSENRDPIIKTVLAKAQEKRINKEIAEGHWRIDHRLTFTEAEEIIESLQ